MCGATSGGSKGSGGGRAKRCPRTGSRCHASMGALICSSLYFDQKNSKWSFFQNKKMKSFLLF
jgi:hypothetical protein